MKPKPTDKPRHAGAITEADRNELNTSARQGDKLHTTIMVPRGRSKKKAIENFLRKTKQLKQ